MKKGIFLLGLIFLMGGTNAQAHPPKNIEAEYIQEEGKLYILIEHLSRDPREHYIRKVTISVNGEEVITERMHQQVDPNKVVLTLDLEAEGGDQIEIKAYCSEGGTHALEIEALKEEDKGKKSVGEVKAKIEGLEDKDASADVYGSKENVFGSDEDVDEEEESAY